MFIFYLNISMLRQVLTFSKSFLNSLYFDLSFGWLDFVTMKTLFDKKKISNILFSLILACLSLPIHCFHDRMSTCAVIKLLIHRIHTYGLVIFGLKTTLSISNPHIIQHWQDHDISYEAFHLDNKRRNKSTK